MPERLIGAVLKTAGAAKPPGVRIPLPPHLSLRTPPSAPATFVTEEFQLSAPRRSAAMLQSETAVTPFEVAKAEALGRAVVPPTEAA